MAYENQIRCIECGESIPQVPEDASYEEMLCDSCNDIDMHFDGSLMQMTAKVLCHLARQERTTPDEEGIG